MSRDELVISPQERRVRLEKRLKAVERVVGIPRRDDPQEPAVLSFGQERLWFLAELEPESSAYHVARVFHLRGQLSVERLAAALSGLISRHETLRTGFRLTPEGPRQEVRAAPEATRDRRAGSIPVVDLAALAVATRQRLRPTLARAEARRLFRLERQPALRLVLLAEAVDQWVLFLTAHHIAVDAASFVILYRELSAFYRDPFGSELPPLPVQYADYAAWQRQRLDEAALERQVKWWREELEGAPRVLELPADRPRPRVASLEGSSAALPLSPTVVDALRAQAAERASTPFALVLAAFAALLGRQTWESDLLLGTAVAERPRRELEPLVGLFINTLVLRLELQGGPTFGQLASRSREAARRALAHQELPFEKLVEALDLERDLSRSPLVQVMVLWQREELEGLKLPGVEVTPVALAREQAQLDLSLAVIERADGLSLHAQYAVDLFDATRISRLLAALSRLLAAGLGEPTRPIATLPLLSPAEEAQLLREWNDREVDGFEASTLETTLVDLVRERAAASPEAVALVDGQTRWSYGALGREVNGLAGRLAALGVGPESRVGVSLPRSSELVVSLLAVQAAGGAYVPLDPAYPEERLGFMVEDSGTRVVVAGPEERRHLATLAQEVAWVEPGERAELAPRPRASARNLAYLIYTSGSTGRPKAVAIEHRSAVAMVAWALATFGAEELAGVLLATSMAFDLSVFEIFATLAAGGKLIVGENAFALAELPARYEVTLLNTVPGAASELEHAGAIPASVRTINLAGEPLPGTVARRLHGLARGIRLWNLYGPSEDTTYSTASQVAAGPGEPTLGRPLPDTEALVLDARREIVPLGVPGELFLAGLGLARGYLGRPGLTAERFVPHPRSRRVGARAYKTGDLVRWLPTAELEFLGRLDHQVKIRGFRIELGEVEAALLALPAVAEAVVVARRESSAEPARLVAYVCGPNTGVEEVPPDSAAITSALALRLPQHMVPAVVVALHHMPRLPNGKIDRKRLPTPEARSEEAAYEPPSSTVELALAEIWAELLKVDRVGRSDHFFSLGGHSLLAVRLVARLRDRLGVELPVKTLFERPRLADLASSIAELAPAEAEAPLVPVSRQELLPLSFPQLRLWILDRLTPGSTAANIPLRLDFEGDLKVSTLSRALAAVERRHEALRTTFYLPVDEALNGEPAQHIAPFAVRPLAVVDLAALPASEHAAGRLAERHRQHLFDLERGPLFVRSLLRLGRRHHRLLANQHHIISDGWSIAVWFRELVAGLAERELPPQRLDYADFAVWQRRRMSGERLAAEVGFWRRELVGAPPLLELPTDRPRPAVQTFRGGRVGRTLSREVSRRLVLLAQERSATHFMLHLAALSTLLARQSGQDEVMVGTPVAGRGRQELEGLLGCFLNTLVLRMRPAGATSFGVLVEQARETALSAFAHGEVPFEKLLDELSVELGIERDLSRTPLFQVMLNVLNFPREGEQLPGLKLALSGHQEVEAKFDLTLYVREVPELGGAITWSLVYNADLFDASRMEILLGQLETLLEQAVESPGRSLGAFSLLTPETRALLPDPGEPLSAAFVGTVVDRFVSRAEAAPDLPAVIEGEIYWTYAELATATHRLAHTLADAGFVPGERVAIVAHRSAPLTLAVLAALEAGGVYFILDPAYPAARLVDFVELARPKALLALAAAGVLPEALEEALERVGCTVRFELPATAFPPALPPGAERSADTPLGLVLDADSPAVVGFTSGSTGKPKGILGRHGSLTHFMPWQAARFGLGERDRFSLLSGLAHDPLQRDLFTPLQLGGAVVVPDPERLGEPGYLAGWFAERGVTVAHLTPAMAQLLTTTAGSPPRLEALRLAFLVGDVLTRRDVDKLRGLAPALTVVNHYGSTETQRAVGYHVATEAEAGTAATSALPLGRGIPDVQLLVFSAEGGLCGVGEVGEIAVRSPHLALGYLGDEALSAERFRTNPATSDPADRLYLTGDLGRYLPNGEVAFAGRADTQVKIRGFRVELGEIEAVLAAHPAVAAAAVLARDSASGKRLAAYVVARSPLGDDELRNHVSQYLPAYMVPAAVVFLERLPLTPNGKLDRRALPEPIWSGVGQGESAAPETPLEVLLAALWAELLGVESVGREDAFFAIGGHSLLATRLVARLAAELGFDVPLRAVFEFPRLADLAAEIERLGRGPALPPLLDLPSDEPAPLSWAQLRLWILTELEPESAVNNLPARLRLRGELEVAALAWALAEIERRHHGLRSTFARVGEEPRQVVGPPGPAHLPVIDLAGLKGEARLEAAKGLARRAAHQVMRLDLGPLFRRRLLRLGEGEHSLLLNQHHIVADGWSRTVLYRELSALYRARRAGLPSPLSELSVQVADFARWQHQSLEGPALAGKLALLKERLAGAPPLLELPTDRPRGRAQHKRAGHLVHELSPELSDRLTSFARAEGATLFMAQLAALAALLSRWSGQDDVVIGTPVAGRPLRALEGLIGCFLNTAALRLRPEAGASFRELVAGVRRVAVEAYAHQDVPFEKVLSELDLERHLDRSPLFQVFLNMLSFEREAPAFDGIEVEPEGATEESEARFDLTLYVGERAGALAWRLLYDAELFDAARMEALAEELEALLGNALLEPDQPLGRLSLLTPRMASLLPDPAAPLSAAFHGTVVGRFVALAERNPERPAVVEGEVSWSYGELATASHRLARALVAGGLASGDRVAILAHRSAPLALAVLAALEAGGVILVLDPAYPVARLIDFVELGQPRALLVLAAAGAVPPELDLALGRVACALRLTLPPTAAPPDLPSEAAGLEPRALGLPLGADSPAVLGFTSGSTGKPKGILGRHGSLTHFIPWQAARFGLDEHDRYSLLSGLAHDPLQRDLFTPLQLGASIHVPEPERIGEPGYLAGWFAARGITVAHLTPAMAQLLTTVAPSQAPSRLETLRLSFLVGDVLTGRDVARLRELAPGITVVNHYGSTETQRAVGYHVAGSPEPSEVLPLGRGIEDVQLLVRNGEGGLCAVGELGEIALRSPHLALGYWRDPELSARKFLPAASALGSERLYLTGDLGRHLPNGEVAFAGRADTQVKIRGFRVELGEIEAVLGAHPRVEAVAVLARDGAAGKRLVAYLVAKEELSAEDVRQYAARGLPDFMVPQAVVFLDQLPLTPNGKLDRRALPEPQAPVASGDELPPSTALGMRLATWWSELLDLPRVGREDDFFALGGHSLLATQLAARLEGELGGRVPLRLLFEFPRLEAQAEALAALTGRASDEPARPPLIRLPAGAVLPASFAQERLWFLRQLADDDTAFHLPGAFRLRGALLPRIWDEALRALARRHEVLRARLVMVEGVLTQPISPPAFPAASWLDLRALSAEDRQARERRLAAEETRARFDLEHGPLFRARFLRLGSDEALLFLTLHHTVADGWSLGVLVRDLSELYGSALAGRPSSLPPLALSYGDFAAWQRGWLAGDTLAALVAGWRQRLEGAPPLLELATDRPRSAAALTVSGRLGLQVPVKLTAGVVAALSRLGREEGATLFMALLAGYAAWLARWSGQRDVVVGTPIASRGLPALENLVGFFSNMLALRLEVRGAENVRQLVGRAREVSFWAFAHQDVPFERLVAELSPERDLSHTPIFQTALGLQNMPRSEWQLPGLVLERQRSPVEAAQLDLALSLVERGGAIEGVCQYDAALFDRTTVLRFVAQFERLLAVMAETPERRFDEVDGLAAAERHQTRREWNDTAARQPAPATVPALFRRQAQATTEAVAVSCEDEHWSAEQWSYSALLDRAEAGARTLGRLGVGAESRVGLYAPRSVATVEMVLAITLAGAAYVPIEPGYPLERQLFLLDDAEVCCLATAESLPPALAAGLEERGITRVDWRLRQAEKVAAGPRPTPLPDNLAYVLYTSGSTGQPKGVAVTHRAIIRLVFGSGYAQLGPGEVVLHLAAVPFDASTFEIWGALLTGARLFVQPGLPALHLLGEALERERVSTAFITSGLFHQLVEEAPGALAGLRQLMAGGEVLSPEAVGEVISGVKRRGGRVFSNVYGPTESTTFATAQPFRGGQAVPTPVPIGRPIGNTRLVILETSGQGAPIGVPGDLALGGLGLARGYWRRPALTASRFVPDGVSGAAGERLYLTGDRARLLADGRVEFLGRLDFQVKIRGFRIEMGEIEAALTQLPEVGQAVVVAVADGQGVLQRLAAYVTPSSAGAPGGAAPDPAELKRHLRDRLPPFMVPAAIVVLPNLPLNSSGKVDRKRLPPPHLDLSRPDYVAAETPLEKLLAALWQEVLGVGEVGRDDDFFALGGHSLAVTRVFARVRSQLGFTVPLGTFFEHTKLRDMAAALEPFTRAASQETELLREAEEGGELPATHGQQGMWVFAQLDPTSTALHLPNTLELAGPLEAQTLARALATVVARHETLRTALVATEGRLVQRRVEFPRPVLPLLDLSALGEPSLAHNWANHLARWPFDLAAGPLARFALLRQARDRHLLSLTFHHAIADGWSDAVFVEEVSRLYRGEALLAPVQFEEQVRWQARELAGPSRARWLAAARQRLAGLPQVLQLPTDRPRDLAGGHGSASVPLRLPAELVAALGRLGASAQATPFMTLLAGFGAVLARWTGVPELLVGTPLAGRTRPELERVIGLVMNQVPLAVRAGDNPSFSELLARTRQEALRAFDQQELPFELLVTELGVERTPGLHPLFQVVFALQNFPPNTWHLPGLECRRLPTERGGTAVDLTFFLTESEGAIEGFVELDAQLFDAVTIHRLVGHYQILLEEVAAFPERRLADLTLLRPAERQQLLVEGSGTWEHTVEPVGPEALVVRQARILPERVAVVEPDGARWSYAALVARSGELANRLRAAGAGPERVVAVLAERSFSTLAALLAVARSGAAFLPLDPKAPPERTRGILADSGAVALVAGATDASWLGDGLPPRIDPEGLWEHGSAPEPDFPESRLAYVIYTSGSTGQPKGVMVESRSLASFVAAAVETYDIGPEDRVLQLASLSFDACQEEIWPALSRGATLFLRDEDWLGSVTHFLSRVADLGLTLLDLPTAFWHHLVADLEVASRPLPPSLRLVILGGERVQARPARFWSALGGPATVNTYGPTEATVVATAWWLPRRAWTHRDPREAPIGGPLPGVEAQVVDRALRLVALGTPGELVLGGAQLARGYLGLPARTAAFFAPDPFARRPGARLYRTGDLVRRLPDGALDYLGRTDRQLKVRGFRVEPKEIEALLATVPGVRQAVVVPWPGKSGAVDRLVAYLVTAKAVEPAELRAFLTGRLPEVMIPAAWVALETLPLTVSGKVDLKALPPPQIGGVERVREAPETDTEIFVAELWRELLKVGEVGRLDSFFALGGHSLLATQLLSRLERELELKVPLRLLFDSPRLADFAAGVEGLLVAGEEG